VKRDAAKNWKGNSGTPTPPPVELDEVVCTVAELALMALLAAVDEDEAAVRIDVEPGAVDVVEVLEVVVDRAASGTTEREEPPLLATNTSPFPES
jgi:hypothetical protein